MTGLVSLVGAGPGDPELLTLKAARRLAEADLVLYDALVAPEALAHAPKAHRFFVGKRAGRPGIGQDAIHALMIRWARRGRRVVRLKCGDPFVFGRGGEEVSALAAAGIPVEVVPGVSSALAAPTLAGIPLTQRGVASAFVVLSGHAPDALAPTVDALVPKSATVVVLMGLATRGELARRLLARGWPADTPAAVILSASTPGQLTWTGSLSRLEQAVLQEGAGSPGVIVIGEVVALRANRALAQPADQLRVATSEPRGGRSVGSR
jgi:uroporphyrin-III C-methyltransferase/precorrin-2 dehydrogenase/sirohydrochlorin ferrochelatase